MNHLREATHADIPRLQQIRHAVKENVLSDPSRVKDSEYEAHIDHLGKGWIYQEAGVIAGFAIVNLPDRNIWALFVHPDQEGRGIGRLLHDRMLNWYFDQTHEPVWLSTAPGTRAEKFYRKAGWKETGLYGKGEIRFEMSAAEWAKRRPAGGPS